MGLIEKVVFILAVVYEIFWVVDIFVLCVFGIFNVIVLLVIVVGAVGVGVGFVINCLNNEVVMIVAVCSLVEVLVNVSCVKVGGMFI